MMTTLTVHCQWEDETVREGTGHLPSSSSYAKAKKIKLLTLHTHGCLRASLRDCSSSTPSQDCSFLLGLGREHLWREHLLEGCYINYD